MGKATTNVDWQATAKKDVEECSGMFSRRRLTAISALLVTLASSAALSQVAPGRSVEAEAKSALATSLILTDTEAITFGFLSFDPEQLPLELDGEQFGSENSLERRRSVRSLTLPWKTQFNPEASLSPYLKARLSYLDAEQEVIAADNGEQNRSNIKDRVYGGYIGGGFGYDLNSSWRARLEVGAHLLQYDNQFEADGLVGDVTESATSGFSSNATALIGELQTRLGYSGEAAGVPWKFESTYSYYAGETVSTDDQLQSVRPETWSWSNGVTVRWPLPQLFDTKNSLRLLARRVDVGGDVTATLNTRKYYAFGVGWLFEPGDDASWFDNVGLSAQVNIGSSLSGGTLVLLYNEQW